jgi:hypothetical protein
MEKTVSPGRYYGELDKEIEEYGSPTDEIDFDPEIRGFVRELLHMGYSTQSSCAGHPGSTLFARGFVHFDHDLTQQETLEVHNIAKRFGLKHVRVTSKLPGRYYGSVDFAPIGKRRA